MEIIYYNIHMTTKENNQLRISLLRSDMVVYDLFIVLTKKAILYVDKNGISQLKPEKAKMVKNTHTISISFSHLSKKTKTIEISINMNSNRSMQNWIKIERNISQLFSPLVTRPTSSPDDEISSPETSMFGICFIWHL
jgi:Leucine-rich repeat (LRR) protein